MIDGMKMAERVARSKHALTQAVLELLRDQSTERITITDVCRAANVTRPTFYQYYRSVDDLIAEAIAQRLGQHQATAFAIGTSTPQGQFGEALAHFLNLIWEDRNLVFLLRSRDIDLVRLRMASVDVISAQIIAHRLADDDPTVELRARFAAAGTTELLGAWLASDNPQEEQPLYTALLLDLMSVVMRVTPR